MARVFWGAAAKYISWIFWILVHEKDQYSEVYKILSRFFVYSTHAAYSRASGLGRHRRGVGLMLGQRRRQWINFNPTPECMDVSCLLCCSA